jgi:hypothetical protein
MATSSLALQHWPRHVFLVMPISSLNGRGLQRSLHDGPNQASAILENLGGRKKVHSSVGRDWLWRDPFHRIFVEARDGDTET